MNQPTLIWLRQIGTALPDEAFGIAADLSGNVYLCGYTESVLVKGQAQGMSDAFLAKYDAAGNQLWIKQIGTTFSDGANDITTDHQGNVFICGYVRSIFDQEQDLVTANAFLAKYDSNGHQVWIREAGSSAYNSATGITADHLGNVFICGHTEEDLMENGARGLVDAFIAKYDTDGSRLWLRQIGTTSDDAAGAIVTDHLGNVFFCGDTEGDLEEGNAHGSVDAFLAKYDPEGNQLWLKQIGSRSVDQANGIATDLWGNVLICGDTRGILEKGQAKGSIDAFLAKYDPEGNQLWLKQIGTASSDVAHAVATDESGNVLICGDTRGSLEEGHTAGRWSDAFVAKYDPSGALIWLKQFGTESRNSANAITTHPAGNIIICGSTEGNLEEGAAQGVYDAFLARFAG